MKVKALYDGWYISQNKWYEVKDQSGNYYILEGNNNMPVFTRKNNFLTESEVDILAKDDGYDKSFLPSNTYGIIGKKLNDKGVSAFSLKLKLMKGEKLTNEEKLILFSLIDEEESHCNLKR